MSVNWHVWPRCNLSCGFCFATFKDIREPLAAEEALRIPGLLAAAGTRKITFVGGEPLLCPHLPQLVKASKAAGLTTMIVTNGWLLNAERLAVFGGALDWVAVSIDSPNEETQRLLGRGKGDHVARAVRAAGLVKNVGIRLKVNTVVTALNWNDDFHELIGSLGPERWKVFQVLPIAGVNDAKAKALAVTDAQFKAFLARHADLAPIAEDNDAMTGSYLMMDPLGRFFQNSEGRYQVSASVLEVGVEKALAATGWNPAKFIDRGGLYAWETPRGVL